MQMTLALVESAINRFLAMDLEAAELIAPLEGKLIGILPRAVDEPICCLISGARIEVITQPQRTPDLVVAGNLLDLVRFCLLYTSPSPRDGLLSRMPSSA